MHVEVSTAGPAIGAKLAHAIGCDGPLAITYSALFVIKHIFQCPLRLVRGGRGEKDTASKQRACCVSSNAASCAVPARMMTVNACEGGRKIVSACDNSASNCTDSSQPLDDAQLKSSAALPPPTPHHHYAVAAGAAAAGAAAAEPAVVAPSVTPASAAARARRTLTSWLYMRAMLTSVVMICSRM